MTWLHLPRRGGAGRSTGGVASGAALAQLLADRRSAASQRAEGRLRPSRPRPDSWVLSERERARAADDGRAHGGVGVATPRRDGGSRQHRMRCAQRALCHARFVARFRGTEHPHTTLSGSALRAGFQPARPSIPVAERRRGPSGHRRARPVTASPAMPPAGLEPATRCLEGASIYCGLLPPVAQAARRAMGRT
jgi:hypothetical protein